MQSMTDAVFDRSFLHASAMPMVFIVSADESVREILQRHARRQGWHVQVFAQLGAFLARPTPPAPACLVLDIGGPDIHQANMRAFIEERRDLPVICVAEHATVRTTVCAMKAGAVEFLTKPFDLDLVREAIYQALRLSESARTQTSELPALRQRLRSLSGRERKVMEQVISGRLNKQIADDLGISEITVEVHRGQVMRKMCADSLPHLMNMTAALEITRPRPTIPWYAATQNGCAGSSNQRGRVPAPLEPLHTKSDALRQPSSLFVQDIAQGLAARVLRRYRDTSSNPARRQRSGLPAFKLRRVLALMESRLDQEFHLEGLASEAGLSEFHFSRAFKSSTGFSPSRFLIRMRMDQAQRLLRETDRSIVEVSLDVGYSSPSHFAQLFRREVGVSPREYRDQG